MDEKYDEGRFIHSWMVVIHRGCARAWGAMEVVLLPLAPSSPSLVVFFVVGVAVEEEEEDLFWSSCLCPLLLLWLIGREEIDRTHSK
jgi:hypothetical protein